MEEILLRSPLKPGSQNLFSVADNRRWTHIRLNIFPDGGVARLRIYGDVVPDWSKVNKNSIIDLAAVEHGGLVVRQAICSSGRKKTLSSPGRAKNMGDGWETKRRRGPGHDWVIVTLGHPGTISKIEVDTNHFRGNYPDRCSIDVCYEPNRIIDALTCHEIRWKELLPQTKLHAHARHFFSSQLKKDRKGNTPPAEYLS